jgi:methylmalonyl-CoA/ethylmalonyl-CoA epimerase
MERLARFDHVGVIVRDMDKAVDYYHSLGFGPFEPMPELHFAWLEDNGKPPAKDTVLAFRTGKVGNARFELIHPVSGQSMQMDFLKKKGEGIHHVAYLVDDIEKVTGEMKGKGLRLLVAGRFKEGGGIGFFNTDEYGGVVTEYIQWPHV